MYAEVYEPLYIYIPLNALQLSTGALVDFGFLGQPAQPCKYIPQDKTNSM
jgi:hypothetical protein